MDETKEKVNNNISLLNCPNLTDEDKTLYRSFSYWVGGVGISCVAIPGLIMNLIAICVLLKSISRKNNFNPLIDQNRNIPYLVDQHLLDKENAKIKNK